MEREDWKREGKKCEKGRGGKGGVGRKAET
jgi:hypothetical protein